MRVLIFIVCPSFCLALIEGAQIFQEPPVKKSVPSWPRSYSSLDFLTLAAHQRLAVISCKLSRFDAGLRLHNCRFFLFGTY
jgi:hypothetical protein